MHTTRCANPLLAKIWQELLHEEVASHRTSWTRIHPPPTRPSARPKHGTRPDTAAAAAPAEDDNLLHQGPGFATDLDEATIDFLRGRARAKATRRLLDVAAVEREARNRTGS